MHRSSHRKVLIKGAYGEGNLGDDALMMASYQTAARAFSKADIFVLGPQGSYIPDLIPGAKVVGGVGDLGDNILFVYGGGTQFFSFENTKTTKAEYWKGRFKRVLASPKTILEYFDRRARQAASGSIRYAAVGIGVGPFEINSMQEKYAKESILGMDHVSVRDATSLRLLEEWGVRDALVGADLCYQDEALFRLISAKCEPSSSKMPGENKIGIVLRDWPHSDTGPRCLAAARKLFFLLKKLGKSVSLISFCPESRSRFLKDFFDGQQSCLCWDPREESLGNFFSELSRFDVFLTARFHGAIFSALMGKPFICIELEQKLSIVAKELGVETLVWKDPFRLDEALYMLDLVEGDYVRIRGTITERVEARRKLAATMVEDFLVFVNGGSSD